MENNSTIENIIEKISIDSLNKALRTLRRIIKLSNNPKTKILEKI